MTSEGKTKGQAARKNTGRRDVVRSRIADYKTPQRVLFLPALPKGLIRSWEKIPQ